MAEPAAQTAFAEEALTHLDTLYRGALRLTHDPDQAQDLVQAAYLRPPRYQHSYQAGPNLTGRSHLPGARQQLQKSLYDYAVESGIVRPSGMEQVPQQ